MKQDISEYRKFLIQRLGYVRYRAKLSGRELSQRLGCSVAYIAKFEHGDFNMPSEILLNAIEICGSTPEEYFSENIETYNKAKQLISLYNNLSPESKKTIFELIKNLK